MMSDTLHLYRAIFDDDRGDAVDPYPIVAYNWKGERWGEWVPVVPDYEAAFRQRSPNYVITREEMKRYIDAALGAGNGDNDEG